MKNNNKIQGIKNILLIRYALVCKHIPFAKGYFVVNLTWTCEQPNPMVKILAYRVYVNGKQYGTDLASSVRTIRIKV